MEVHMKILIVGSGGREHAIAASVAKSPKAEKIYCAPGNAGIAQLAECVPIGAMEFDRLTEFAKEKEIDLVIVGMDDPLVGGLVDQLEAAGIRAFGPRKNAAILEGSKAFSKDLMKKYGIPTAAYETFDTPEAALNYLETAPDTLETPAAEPQVQETEAPKEEAGQKVVDRIVISSPISGTAADLVTAPDEAFAQKMMGDGAVVTPEDPYVRAPEDGEVAFVFDTKHAIVFVTESGISLLIHVGIDTVKLNGEGFEALVESGQEVKKGDPMLKLDLDYLSKNAPSIVSPVLCTELEDNQRIHLLNEGQVKAGEPLFEIEVLQ